MAVGTSDYLKWLQSEVTCPLCLDIFTEPKKLPCDHVYCRACLHGLALRSITGKIDCPECRREIPIPANGVADYPTAHQVNRFLERYHQESLKSAESGAAIAQPATCNDHRSQPLALYCETCEKLVCRDCALTICAKRNHKHDYIDAMVKRHESDMKREIEPLNKLYKNIKTALQSVSTSKKDLFDQRETKFEKIEKHFDALMKIISDEKKQLIFYFERLFQEQNNLYTAKENELSEMLRKLESIIESVDSISNNKSKSAFLLGIGDKRRNIQQCKKAASSVSHNPVELPTVEVNMCLTEEFKKFNEARNFLYTKSDSLKCHFDRADRFSIATLHELSTLTIVVDTQSVKKGVFGKFNIEAELHPYNNDSAEKVNVKKDANEKYSLSFTPEVTGPHEIIVKYNGKFASRLQVYVIMPPNQLEDFVFGALDGASAIKFHRGKIYVVEAMSAVNIMNPYTNSIKRIEAPGVIDILIDDVDLYATSAEHRLVKMDMKGTVLASTGTKGDGPGQFNFPNGIQLSRDNEIYVCDSYNHRIQVFDKNLHLIRTLGKKGIANGCFNWPADLGFDDEGNIYVADYQNSRVQVFTPQGQHIRNIGRSSSDPKKLLASPVSPIIHRGLLYVTDDNNHSILVFKTTGEYVKTMGENILPLTECMAFDDKGSVYVTYVKKIILKLSPFSPF